MNKVLLAVLIVIVVVGGFMLVSRGYPAPKPMTQPQQQSQQPGQISTSGAITINNFVFSPGELDIKAGTKVTWTNNQDGIPHQIVSDPDGTTFKSDPLQTGQSYSFTFDKVGSYSYHCGIHPMMTGKIVVQ